MCVFVFIEHISKNIQNNILNFYAIFKFSHAPLKIFAYFTPASHVPEIIFELQYPELPKNRNNLNYICPSSSKIEII